MEDESVRVHECVSASAWLGIVCLCVRAAMSQWLQQPYPRLKAVCGGLLLASGIPSKFRNSTIDLVALAKIFAPFLQTNRLSSVVQESKNLSTFSGLQQSRPPSPIPGCRILYMTMESSIFVGSEDK